MRIMSSPVCKRREGLVNKKNRRVTTKKALSHACFLYRFYSMQTAVPDTVIIIIPLLAPSIS